ncbi:MAG: cache domain-containing protein [Bacteroidetes bacterium]|nr:cache domain-containing protein [Bacteroidota bacterium]
MKSKRLINVNSIGWVVIFLAIVLLYVSYFFIYVPQQEEALNRRAFRILKEYGNSIHEKYDYYRKHVENYDIFYTFKFVLESDWQDYEMNDLKDALNEIDLIKDVIGGLERSVVTDTLPASAIRPSDKNYRGKLENGYLSFISHNFYTDIIFNKDGDQELVHKVPIEKLMEGLKFDRLFDNMVMFDSSKVLYNYNQDFVQDITNPKAISDSTRKLQGGIIESIRVRGEKKHVMVVPFRFLGKNYFLAGFVSGKAYQKKTRSIDSQLLIVIAGVLLLILAGMPVLKLIFINRKERLHARDASWTTLSLILGVGLFVLILLSIMKHYVVDQEMLRNRIENISGRLYHNFQDDVDEILDLHSAIIAKPGYEPTDLSLYTNMIFMFDSKIAQLPQSLLKNKIPINEILLISKDGKVSEAATRTPFMDSVSFEKEGLNDIYVPIDLSERLYFKNAINKDSSWYERDREINFYIESIKSYNTGYQETAISFPLDSTWSHLFGEPVMAITSALPSMYHQTLPKDIHYVVINRQGNVMFHSIKSKNLHENFLDECGRDVKLMGAMKHRGSTIIPITYNEKKWLARIVPIPDTPLSHITLLDLEKNQNQNARIFLITFYLMLATFICIGIGMLVIQLSNPHHVFIKRGGWSLSWLWFQSKWEYRYKKLLIVQVVLIVAQGLGMFFIGEPISLFIYQMIFIAFSGLAVLALAGGRSEPLRNVLKPSHLASTLIMLIILILFGLFWYLNPGIGFLVSTGLIVVLYIYIHYHSKKVDRDDAGSEMQLSTTDPNEKQEPNSAQNNASVMQTKRIYLVYMFVWLLSLTAVPVVEYYRAVKLQEDNLWHYDKVKDMAEQNLMLNKQMGNQSQLRWFRQIQGNGLDGLTFKIQDSIELSDLSPTLSSAGKVYAFMPDPLTQKDDLAELLKNKSDANEWEINDSLFTYSKGGMEGFVTVKSREEEPISLINWVLYLLLPILLAIVFVWRLFIFLSDSILNTAIVKWIDPPTNNWAEILTDETKPHILLITLQEKKYREKAQHIFASGSLRSKEGARSNPSYKIEPLYAGDLSNKDHEIDKTSLNKDKLIWVYGTEDIIYQPDLHPFFLKNLRVLMEKSKGKLVISMPFEFDYIDEVLEANEGDKETFYVRQNWVNLIRDFFKFTGAVDFHEELGRATTAKSSPHEEGLASQKECVEESEEKLKQFIGTQGRMEPHYFYIWNNLNSMEKMILFDLADDGMLNLKNKIRINKLIARGLIVRKPFPQLFDETFRLFIKYSVNPDETKMLEHKLSRQGKWRSMRYLILLILIPIAGFIFIAQGTSIEKVIGIFTGVLALFSGLMRLLDSRSMQQTN